MYCLKEKYINKYSQFYQKCIELFQNSWLYIKLYANKALLSKLIVFPNLGLVYINFTNSNEILPKKRNCYKKL